MIRIWFQDDSPLPFREWDIENGKIVRCDPDPEVSWVGVYVPLNEAELFTVPFDVHVAWGNGDKTPLPISSVMRIPSADVVRP